MKQIITNRDIYEEILMGKKAKEREKQRHQIKSRWYYIFWGTATVSVVLGQLYVGSGYRRMSETFEFLIKNIGVEKVEPGIKYY